LHAGTSAFAGGNTGGGRRDGAHIETEGVFDKYTRPVKGLASTTVMDTPVYPQQVEEKRGQVGVPGRDHVDLSVSFTHAATRQEGGNYARGGNSRSRRGGNVNGNAPSSGYGKQGTSDFKSPRKPFGDSNRQFTETQIDTAAAVAVGR